MAGRSLSFAASPGRRGTSLPRRPGVLFIECEFQKFRVGRSGRAAVQTAIAAPPGCLLGRVPLLPDLCDAIMTQMRPAVNIFSYQIPPLVQQAMERSFEEIDIRSEIGCRRRRLRQCRQSQRRPPGNRRARSYAWTAPRRGRWRLARRNGNQRTPRYGRLPGLPVDWATARIPVRRSGSSGGSAAQRPGSSLTMMIAGGISTDLMKARSPPLFSVATAHRNCRHRVFRATDQTHCNPELISCWLSIDQILNRRSASDGSSDQPLMGRARPLPRFGFCRMDGGRSTSTTRKGRWTPNSPPTRGTDLPARRAQVNRPELL
jgi:hypothetical protein